MRDLQRLALSDSVHDYSEFKSARKLTFDFDFYFPDESIAIEIAMTLQLSRTRI